MIPTKQPWIEEPFVRAFKLAIDLATPLTPREIKAMLWLMRETRTAHTPERDAFAQVWMGLVALAAEEMLRVMLADTRVAVTRYATPRKR